MFLTILASSYFLVAVFYFVSGVMLFHKPHRVEHKIPGWFPLLHDLNRSRESNAFNLIIIGALILLVGVEIYEKQFSGIYWALVLSVWEVYIAFRFYLLRKEHWNALGHLVLHAGISLGVATILMDSFSGTLSNLSAKIFDII